MWMRGLESLHPHITRMPLKYLDKFVLSRLVGLKVRADEEPRSIWQRMLSGNLPLFGRDAQRARADSQECGGFGEGQPAGLLTQFWIITGDAVPGAQRCHAFLSEAVAAAGPEVVAIEVASDLAIGADPRTASMMSGDVQFALPRRRHGTRSSVWMPPCQWITSVTSFRSSSRSTITSWISVRTMRFFSRASDCGSSFGSVGQFTPNAASLKTL